MGLNASLWYNPLEPEEVRKEVLISGTKKGLGIRIVGGRTMQMDADGESYFGIFVKEVIRNSLAEKEGMVYLSMLVSRIY